MCRGENDAEEGTAERIFRLKEIAEESRRETLKILTGFDIQDSFDRQKKKLMVSLGVNDHDWEDWRWQLSHRISEPAEIGCLLGLPEETIAEIDAVGRKFRWAVSPYYAALMDPNDPACPICKQALPTVAELNDTFGTDDPMAEGKTSPVSAITRRYPDRLIVNVTNQCASFCRHCQRRRNIRERDCHTPKEALERALAYIRDNVEIRDVLLTGGDALTLADETVDWLLWGLDKIDHLEIKRLGTRTPVTLPQRITPDLVQVLRKHPPIYLNTQFNHPREITPEARAACDGLLSAGVVLGNQAVLLKGVNDNPYIIQKLGQELLKIRVRPYYLYQAKPVKGTSHFITRLETGLKIMEHLRGRTSGLAIPTFVINAPGGYGKVPILPQYLLSMETGQVTLRTWENRVICIEDGPGG